MAEKNGYPEFELLATALYSDSQRTAAIQQLRDSDYPEYAALIEMVKGNVKEQTEASNWLKSNDFDLIFHLGAAISGFPDREKSAAILFEMD